MRRLNNHGDTIIEVLMAIMVISTILGGAFVASNRSLNASRQAEERGEALKLAEEQLERVKSLSKIRPSPLPASGTFCINNSNSVNVAASCPNGSLGVTYNLSVERTGNDFKVLAKWQKAGGGDDEEARLIYRVHP